MRKLILTFFGFLFAITLGAQSVTRLPLLDHLSSPVVNALAWDEDGFLWVGTSRGLNRFNGSAYRVYLQRDSLFNDYITSLYADTEQRLWVGTNSGIALLRGGRVDPSVRLKVGRVFSLSSLDKGHLLYSTRSQLSILDKATGESRPVYKDSRLSFNRFIRTRDGHIWINHLTRPEITVLDERYQIVREIELPGRNIRDISEAGDGDVYVSTDSGLLRFTADGSAALLSPALQQLTKGFNVLFFRSVPGKEEALLGMQGAGVFSVRDGIPQPMLPMEKYADVESARVLVSPDNIWMSRNGLGFEWVYLPSARDGIPIPEKHSPEALNMFYELDPDRLLVVTNKSIYTYDRANREAREVRAGLIDGKGQINITLTDRWKRFWLVYGFRELRRYEWDGDALRLAFRREVEPTTGIWSDENGNVCLLQSGHILEVAPDDAVSTRPVSQHPEFWFCGQTRSGKTYFLSEDDVWVLSGEGGLEKLNLGVESPSAVYEDANGVWWIGSSDSGLYRYIPESRSLTCFTREKAWSDVCVRSITGDREDNIWVAMRDGVVMIPSNGESELHFTSLFNLQNVLNSNSSLTGQDSTVYFGSMNRIYMFRQSQALNREIPLNGEVIIINGEELLEFRDQEYAFGHDTDQITFYYSCFNYDPGFRPAFQFRLDGYDRDWVSAGESFRAAYSGLAPGSYTFRVRIQRPDGTWGEQELVQRFRIKPSAWLSWPMLILYGLLVLLAVVSIIQLYIRNSVSRERLQLSEQEKLLTEQISQERTNFFTNVSHEFRTPLALIYGPVQELQRSQSLSEQDRVLVKTVEKNTDRMIRLTDQLLQFNRSAAIRDQLAVRRTRLPELLRKMLENFEYMFRQKNLHVHLEAPAELDVYCDREKVERIVFNLLSNAVKYTPDHGAITVSCRKSDAGEALVEVADTGIGIAPEKMSRIFNRFERVGEKVGGDLPSGFGVGLNYAQHLARLHKGDLSVRPNDPIGSVFCFSFPASKEAYSAESIWNEESPSQILPEEKDWSGEPEDGAETNILVVEDNADMREYIRSFLGKSYRVMMAGDGEEAWKCIRITAPDIVVSDVMMPYKDGYTLCKELKNDPEYCHIPVILLTAKADMESRMQGMQLGADAYIAKPFDPEYFLASVKNLLDNRRRIQHVLTDSTAESLPLQDERMDINSHDKAFLEKLYNLAEAHIADENFNVTAMALELGMSRTSLFSKLKTLLGQSPQAFLMGYRLNRAKELLKEGDLNVSEVAYRVGFSTLTGFSRSFKNKFGIPPSAV